MAVHEVVPHRSVIPWESQVATRAYQRFEARGSVHGFDKEDWEAASLELLGPNVPKTVMGRPQRVAELRSLKHLEGYAVAALDGDVGTVVDFLIDDLSWTVGNLVVQTGTFFHGRQVLITPISFREIDWSARRFHVTLTATKVKNSPILSANSPVSRRLERSLYGYYGYPSYWMYPGLWGMADDPQSMMDGAAVPVDTTSPTDHDDIHLRSVKEMSRCRIEGSDGFLGHIEDFIIDDLAWKTRYLVVNTSNWWVGKRVLIPPHWASSADLQEGVVHLDLTRDAIRGSPIWDVGAPVNRDYEERFYDYYGRPVYWAREKPTVSHDG